MKTLSLYKYAGIAALGVALLTAGCGSDEAGDWPGRSTINIAVLASPGGATDLANRTMANVMERELGATLSVLNIPGAQGGSAANHVWNARRNGNNWFGMSEGALAMPVLGVHSTTSKDWRYFLICGTPGILSVPKDSPYRSVEDLIAAIRERPNEIRMSSAFPGTVWHEQYVVMARESGLQVRWISYPGSHPSQVAALSGEVDVVLTGLGEQAELLRAGNLRPLAVMDTESRSIEGIGDVPAITDTLPELAEHFPRNQYIGFALPADTPEEILETIGEAFHRAMESDEIKRFGRENHSELFGYSGEKASSLMAERERALTWLLYDEQVARHSPESVGIPRP